MSTSATRQSQPQPSVANPITSKGIVSGTTRIGWIGTGVMGNSMLQHVMRALINTDNEKNPSSVPFPTYVYTRTAEKAQPAVSAGAVLCNSVADVARNSDIVFTMLGYPSDVRQVYYGDAEHPGLLQSIGGGGILVDMTTSEPSLAQQIASDASKLNIYTMDAPVSGGDVGAKEAKLSIMIGGEQSVMYSVLPLFQSMGKNITYCGVSGHGQHTKMMNQILIANNMIGICEGLLYAYKSGLDLSTAIQAVSTGAAGSWSISNLGPRIVQRNFDPGFYVDHFVKDMGIALNEAARMKLSLPGLSLARQLYIALQAQGDGLRGTQALILAFERINGLNIPMDKPMITDIYAKQQQQ